MKDGEKKRTGGKDRWGTLSSAELLQGKSCVTEMGGKPTGGGLGRVCSPYAVYCGKLHAEFRNDCPGCDSLGKLLSAAWTLAFFFRGHVYT